MAYFAFRLAKLKLLKTREIGPAEIKLLSFVTADDATLPDLSEYITTDDTARRKAIITDATAKVLSTKVLMQVEHVKHDQTFTFGDTGYALYTAQSIPESFNWSLLVLASNRSVEFWGRQIDAVIENPKFDGFSESLLTVLRKAANPSYTAGVAVAKFVLDEVGAMLARDNEKQVGVVYQTFDRYEHYPEGRRQGTDMPDLSGNVLIDYSIFSHGD